jgi:hypothetical protein
MIAIYSKNGTTHINMFRGKYAGLLDADIVRILVIANNVRERAKPKEKEQRKI